MCYIYYLRYTRASSAVIDAAERFRPIWQRDSWAASIEYKGKRGKRGRREGRWTTHVSFVETEDRGDSLILLPPSDWW